MAKIDTDAVIAQIKTGTLVKGRMQGNFFLTHEDGKVTTLDQKPLAMLLEHGLIQSTGRRDGALNMIYRVTEDSHAN